MSSTPYTKCLDDATDFSVWILGSVAKFSRFYRGTLGQSLANEAIELSVQVQHAAFAIDRGPSLDRANQQVIRIRLLLRMSAALQLVSQRQLGFATEKLDEIGRQIGAWKKHTLNETPR